MVAIDYAVNGTSDARYLQSVTKQSKAIRKCNRFMQAVEPSSFDRVFELEDSELFGAFSVFG